MPAPERAKEQTFLTLVMPLDKGAPAPRVEFPSASALGAARHARLTHPNGSVDEISLSPEGKLSVSRVSSW